MRTLLSLSLGALALLLLACSSNADGTSSGDNLGAGGGAVGGGLAAGGGGPASGGGAGAGAAIDWINFVRFNGITYLANSHSIDQRNPALSRDILGAQHETVRFMVGGNVSDPNYQIKDGDAAFWEKGTPVYAVKGYRPESLLAAVGDQGRIILFEVDSNSSAKQGSDLLDIADKVQGIRLLSQQDGTTELARLSAADAQAFAALVAAAPVDQRNTAMSELAFFVEFQLEGGIVILRAYFGGNGELSRGIYLPLSEVRSILGDFAGSP